MPATSAEMARQLASQGRAQEAAAMLGAAGDAGDAVAAMLLAVWRLVGTIVPRDLAAARAALRQAVRIGHVDAALMEVALTANGSGGPADWAHARELLKTAAARDPLAAAQLACVAAMDLDADGAPRTPPVGRRLSERCRVTHYPAFLTRIECQQLADAAHDILAPAVVVDPVTGAQRVHPVRTSDGAVIGPTRENLVVAAINRRIAATTGTAVAQGEPLALLRYQPGQQYRPHLDTIASAANQRVRTVLLYLNDGFGGGQTIFPELGVTFSPTAGDALAFDTVLPDGRPDPRAIHAGLPVTHGAKWLATRWIRAEPLDPWSISGLG